MTDGTNSIASMTYVGFRPKGTTFGNGTTASYAYAGFREDLTTIHHETSAPATLVRLDYGYNKLHDRTYERYGTSGSAGDAFEYDKARRLTKAWMGSGTPSSPSGNVYVQTISVRHGRRREPDLGRDDALRRLPDDRDLHRRTR